MSENKTNQKAPETKTPETKTPETKTPETKTPEKITPEEKNLEEKKAKEDLQNKIKAAQGGTSFVPKETEQGIYHVKLEKPMFDKNSGKRLSKAFIQKFTIAEFKGFEKQSILLGYKTEILWNPEKFK